MGMDVYGRNPVTPKGEYFRRNVWGWHPLWDLVEDLFPELASGVESPHTNDGDGLAAGEAKVLGHSLMTALDSGAVAGWILRREVALGNLPDRTCSQCEGTGFRLNAVLAPDECFMCGGVGRLKPFERNYHTDESSVEDFAEFLIASGGFNIC